LQFIAKMNRPSMQILKQSSKLLARLVAQNDRCLLSEQPFLSKRGKPVQAASSSRLKPLFRAHLLADAPRSSQLLRTAI